MKITVTSKYDGQERVHDSVLEAVADAEVFMIDVEDKDRFVLTEKCDEWYSIVLTREQLLALAEEIKQLALE